MFSWNYWGVIKIVLLDFLTLKYKFAIESNKEKNLNAAGI